jgi:hypothetical protein
MPEKDASLPIVFWFSIQKAFQLRAAFFERSETTKRLGKLAQGAVHAASAFNLHGGISESDRACRHRFDHPTVCGDHGAIAEFDMTGNSGPRSDGNVVSKYGATCDPRIPAYNAVLTDSYIVADLHQVVNFCAVADDRGAKCRPVNRRIRTDFDVIPYQDDTDLRNLHLKLSLLGKAKTVRTQYGAAVENAPGADRYPFADRNMWIQHGAGADSNVPANETARMDDRGIADFSALVDDGQRPDSDPSADPGVRRHNGRAVDTVHPRLKFRLNSQKNREYSTAWVIYQD